MILFERTESRVQLAAIYTVADCFFNPTREDNYPTVNLEAEACGNWVVSYDTGGCTETLKKPASVMTNSVEETLQLLVRSKSKSSTARR